MLVYMVVVLDALAALAAARVLAEGIGCCGSASSQSAPQHLELARASVESRSNAALRDGMT
jgi:hypothetical protein